MSLEPTLPQWRRLWLGLGVFWLGLDMVISVAPYMPDVGLGHWDKVGHASMYALLMWWFVQLFSSRLHIWIALLLVLLGIGLEVAQGQLPSRQMDWADAAANTAGVLLGWFTVKTRLSHALRAIERYFQRG